MIPLFPLGINLGPIVNVVAPNRKEYVDYQNNSIIDGSRYINPNTNDFELQANGHFVGMPSIQQEVLLAVETVYNSSVMSNFGLDFGSIKIITPNIQKQVLSLFNNALSFLISTNKIRLNSVQTTQTGQSQVSSIFSWTDTTTGTTYQSNVLMKA